MKNRLFFACVFCLSAFFAAGQDFVKKEMLFRSFNAEDGLKSNLINDILVDGQGFVWLATSNGLTRYDGYIFKNIEVKDQFGEKLIFARSLYKSDNRFVWIASHKGLHRFDPKKETLKAFYTEHYVRHISRAANGRFWLGLDDGLLRFDEKNGIEKSFSAKGEKGRVLSDKRVIATLQTDDSTLWIATSLGGLNKLHIQKGSIKHYLHQERDETSISENTVFSLKKDSKGTLWFGTKSGLNIYNPEQDNFTRFQSPLPQFPMQDAQIYDIEEPQPGMLWVSSYKGINIIDLKTGIPRNYMSAQNPYAIINNLIRAISIDRNQNIWVGTENGISLWSRKSNLISFFQFQKQGMGGGGLTKVNSVAEDERGNLWVGTPDGLFYFDLPNKKIRYMEELSKLLPSLNVSSIETDKNILWVGTNLGINAFEETDREKKTFKPVMQKELEQINKASVLNIFHDNKGNVWIGTYNGLLIFDKQSKKFNTLKTDKPEYKEMKNAAVNCVVRDSRSNLWVGTKNYGVYIINDKGEIIDHLTKSMAPGKALDSDDVFCIKEDKEKRIWIGTSMGLNLFLLDKNKIEPIVWETPLLAQNAVNGIEIGTDGQLWLNTFAGIERGQAKGNRLTVATCRSRLKDTLFGNVDSHKDRQGNIYLASNDGLEVFHPDSFKTEEGGGKVAITDFLYFGKETAVSDSLGLEEDRLYKSMNNGLPSVQLPINAGYMESIILDYEDYIFGFRFSTLDYGNPDKILFSYKLENFDKEWVHTQNNQADYTNLPAGRYVFQVKAYQENNAKPNEITSITVVILPPWWLTWWMKAVYVLSVAGGLYLFYRTKVSRLKKQQKHLETEVQKRTAEVIRQNEEIQVQSEEILAQRDTLLQKNEEVVLEKEKLQAAYDNIELLSEIGKKITRHISIGQLSETVYAELNLLMPADGFGIGVFNPKENRMDYSGYIEKGSVLPFHSEILEAGESLSFLCFSQNKEILINDFDREIGGYFPEYKITAGEKPESLIYLPLIAHGKQVGNITIQAFFKNAYTDNHLNIFRNIAVYTAIALDNASLYLKTESLLLNILPKETADELKEKGFASTKRYDKVSVLFTDFKGFTQISETMSPEEVVQNLDYCFRAFDKICKKHRLEKIKTIGDAYMAAGGIPIPDDDNPERAVAAALEINAFMKKWKQEKEARGEKAWQVRIGIHTGPVVAGVVGEDKFAYDIWGDTVNTASRMESSGEPGRVNVSAATRAAIGALHAVDALHATHFPKWQFEYRGKISAKGKGDVEMYFVSLA